MECKRESNLESCGCTYSGCNRQGVCCDCLQYHLRMRELPACCFDSDAERTYDRSFEHFARLVTERKL